MTEQEMFRDSVIRTGDFVSEVNRDDRNSYIEFYVYKPPTLSEKILVTAFFTEGKLTVFHWED